MIETTSQHHEPAVDNRLPDVATITEIPPPSSDDDDDDVPNEAVGMAEGFESEGVKTVPMCQRGLYQPKVSRL